MLNHRTFIFLSVTLLPASAFAQAELLGPAPYLEAADSPFSSVDGWQVEDFESHSLTLAGTSASTGETTLTAGWGPSSRDSVDGDDGVIDGQGNDGDAWYFGSSVTFSFDPSALGSLPTHVGLVWTDGCYLDPPVTVEFFDAANNSLGAITASIGDWTYYGGTAEDRFFGAVHHGGIAAVTLTQSGCGIEVDHLQYAFEITDSDGDGVPDDVDVCPGFDDATDADGDGTPDGCDACANDAADDADSDGVCASNDNCPTVANSNQQDTDLDGVGDACESDTDGDGVIDDQDNCVYDANADQLDTDGDGSGDVCDGDSDGDQVPDAVDACTGTASGEPVLDNGCSVEQAVPCEPTTPWKNRGAYMKAIAAAAKALRSSGKITDTESAAVIADAAANTCGQ